MNDMYLFYLLLFFVAFLYASVGHGGASGYLALMAIFNVAPTVMKPTALLLNLFVAGVSFYQYYKAGYFNKRLFIPFAFASIPLAFVGGLVTIDALIYKKLLGLLLLIPILRFTVFQFLPSKSLKPNNIPLSLLIGGIIGLLSGMLGIGGGILLSPVIILLSWGGQKEAAAVSALFILVNSLSGLAGQMSKGIHFTPEMAVYVTVAFTGGIAGGYLGAKKFSTPIIRNTLACVLTIAAYKLLFTGA